MNSIFWLWTAFSILAALIFSALVWFGGPLVFVMDAQPFESGLVRGVIIAAIWLVVIGAILWRFLRRRRAAAALEKAITTADVEESDAPVLKGKMEDAIQTLRRSSKSGAGALYELPWYLIIGPPGAGKTTALVNSGLKFPLARDNAAKAIEGVGGTRYCDWWFTEQAVLIDTAGRYTTQDSDAKVDRKSWLAFLEMLRRNRPRQPINGVIVAISIADLLTLSPAEINAHADAIRKRLDELHEELKISFPVYAVFTKMDMIAGFAQYFADLDENKRKAVWGATFQTADKQANNVTQAPAELDLLIQRISDGMAERLQEEPDLRARVMLFGFPAQLAAIRKPVGEFLNRIFEPTRYQSTATLRGLYFTSGTQEGTPLDAIIGALQRNFGVESRAVSGATGMGKSYFLHDLLAKVIFAEAGWVSTNVAAVRRSWLLRVAAFALIGLALSGTLVLWWASYSRNQQLIAATMAGFDDYAGAAAPVLAAAAVRDGNLQSVRALLDILPDLPDGYAHREDATPMIATFGLSQRSRVREASIAAYQQSLERLMRPRLVVATERELRKNINDPIFVYEALKVYLMLGGLAPDVDKALIVGWFAHEWDEALAGPAYADARAKLRAHLQAMLDLDEGAASGLKLDGDLIQQARATLAHLPLADRAYTLLKSEAHNLPIRDWIASEHGGYDMPAVFETANKSSLDAVRIPAFFTYAGFYLGLLDPMPKIEQSLRREKWVLGPYTDEGPISQQYSTLPEDILSRYSKEFVAIWYATLANLELRPLLADKPAYVALAAASAKTSPIVYLVESVRDEVALTRERKKSADAGKPAKPADDLVDAARTRLESSERGALDLAEKSQRRPGEAPAEVPGKSIEVAFKDFLTLVDSDARARPVDNLIENLHQLDEALAEAAASPMQEKQALDQVQQQAAILSRNASTLPQPLKGWFEKVAKDALGDANAASIDEISAAMGQEVFGPCQQIVNGRYPFAPKGQDVPMADFGRLFKPGGVFDAFFTSRLAPYIDVSDKTWKWRAIPNLNRKLSEPALQAFQQAAEIRDAFFPNGGAQPGVKFDLKMLDLSTAAQSATLTVDGGPPIVMQTPASAGAVLQWPGGGASGATIALAPDLPDQHSSLDRQGAWALFRLIDAGSVTPRGSTVNVAWIVGARNVSFAFNVNTMNNPIALRSVRQFKCPNGL